MYVDVEKLNPGQTAILRNGSRIQMGPSSCYCFVFISTGPTEANCSTALSLAMDKMIALNATAMQKVKDDFDEYGRLSADVLQDLVKSRSRRAELLREVDQIEGRRAQVKRE
ncbi:hypothetical protein QAD02_018160 [Eretmocerus hayati]|uniref:Uncharacterized protein n=1 Tax=Eretmocerus hayati TaxID=131215 RepID=A0ACC2PH08_9HYME|nr:hypothetical protein QAD02_018160 [Eretmocerus hayati]